MTGDNNFILINSTTEIRVNRNRGRDIEEG